MAEFPSLPLFTDAYIGDTTHLTNEEHGVYLRLLMFAWRSPDCALPEDDKRLAIMVGVTPKKWASLKPAIMSFWHVTEHGWEQDRLTFERQRVKVLHDQKVAAGKASARAKSRKTKKPPPADVEAPQGASVATADKHPSPAPYEVDKSTSSQEAAYQDYLKAHPKAVDSDAGFAHFSALLAEGVDPAQIVGAARSYAETVKNWSAEAKVQQSDNFLDPDRGQWRKHVPPPPKAKASEADVLAFYAKVVTEKKPGAASTVGSEMANRLLANKLVTPQQLSQAGVTV